MPSRRRTRLPGSCELLLGPPVDVAARHAGRHALDPAALVGLVEQQRVLYRAGGPVGFVNSVVGICRGIVPEPGGVTSGSGDRSKPETIPLPCS